MHKRREKNNCKKKLTRNKLELIFQPPLKKKTTTDQINIAGLVQRHKHEDKHVLFALVSLQSMVRHFHLIQSFLFSFSFLLFFFDSQVEPGSEVYDCWASFHPDWTLPAYITWMTASIFIIPTCILGVLYGKITWVVWKAGRLEEKLLPTQVLMLYTCLFHCYSLLLLPSVFFLPSCLFSCIHYNTSRFDSNISSASIFPLFMIDPSVYYLEITLRKQQIITLRMG